MNTDKTKNGLPHLCASVFICGLLSFFVSTARSAEVVLYTSIDQPIAAPIVREFQEQTGIEVTLVADTEATKSVGLAERLRAEKANPKADVWWGNEPFHTINLAEEGLLDAYESPEAKDVPAQLKDDKHRWAGCGVRVRLVAVSARSKSAPRGLEDLTDPALRSKVTMARPTAGTTGGHVAAVYVLWGDERADAFFRKLKANDVRLVGGNSVVAEMVGRGRFLVGLTDNDDVTAASAEGGELSAVLPDQQGMGTLLVPTTVGLVSGAKHPDEAKRLIDFLLSKQTEQKLIDAKFAFAGVRNGVGPSVKAMDVNYRAVAKKLPDAVRRATAILEGRE
jgi:iron(III) transport system substrate-binding protein